MTLAAFLSVAFIHLLAAISPGPSFVVCVRVAVTQGFRTALGLALGFGLGAALWATAALAGLALLFQLVPPLFVGLKLVGGAFLLYLAWRMWRHAKEPLQMDAAATRPMSFWRAAQFGFLTFATNPKPAVFFGAIFVGLVPVGTPLPVLAALIGVIFMNEALWYVLVARVFSMPRARATYTRLKAGIDRSFGGLLAIFGVKIALG